MQARCALDVVLQGLVELNFNQFFNCQFLVNTNVALMRTVYPPNALPDKSHIITIF